MKKLLMLASLGLAGFVWSGCGSIDEAFDCSQICSRYSDCFDENYDVSACGERCRSNAEDDQAFADAANACENCLDEKSCTGSFECTAECAGVVP